MSFGGPTSRYLLLQQLPTGVNVAVSGGGFGFQNSFAGLGNGLVAFFRHRFFMCGGDSSQFLCPHSLYFVSILNLMAVIHRFEDNLGQ